MKKKLTIGLILFSLSFIVGGIIIYSSIDRVVSNLDSTITLHQVEIMRQNLMAKIKVIQLDLALMGTHHITKATSLKQHMQNLALASENCTSCHHQEETLEIINHLQSNISTYQKKVFDLYKMPANDPDLSIAKEAVFKSGQHLIKNINTIVLTSSEKLTRRTQSALNDIAITKRLIAFSLPVAPVISIILVFFLFRYFTRQISILVDSSKRFKKGDLDFKITGMKDEFGIVADSFNDMSSSLSGKIYEVTERDKRYRMVFEGAGDAIFIMDASPENVGSIISANKAAADMHGYTVDELLDMNISELDTPATAEQIDNRITKILSGDWINAEIEHVKKDGSVFPLEMSAGLLEYEGKKFVLGIDRDITERKQAELALKESESKYRRILIDMKEGYFKADLEGNLTFFNQAVMMLLGYTEEELIGKNSRDYIVEEDIADVLEAYNEAYAKKGSSEIGYGITRKNGTQRYVESTFGVDEDEAGNIVGFSGILHDVTDRRRAEQEVKLTSEKLAMLLESLPIVPYTASVDNDFGVTFISKTIEKLTGYKSEQFTDSSQFWADRVHPNDRSRILREMQQVIKHGSCNCEYSFQVADGSYKLFSATISAVHFPDGSISHIVGTIQDLTEKMRLRDISIHTIDNDRTNGLGELVGMSEPMKEVYDRITKIVEKDVKTVLIQGETGTGKDLAAKTIHAKSDRSEHPFLEINCANIPENLLESELFGYEKGAFTDAREMKRGLFEQAPMGTILLNEIGHMRLDLQAKLLDVIENRKFRRVGGLKDLDLDVRLIAATNVELFKAVQRGEFREDLYYRIKLVPIYMPPLRERKEDISDLIDFLIEKSSQEFDKYVTGVTSKALDMLIEYDWPGNVRELKNVINRSMILGEKSKIHSEILPREIQKPQPAVIVNDDEYIFDSEMSLAEMERQMIEKALEKTGGNQLQAAKILDISRHAMRNRMKKFGLL